MNKNRHITAIRHVIFVGEHLYPKSATEFTHELTTQELIFHFSGQNTVQFGNKVLQDTPDSLRYLPKGKPDRYRIQRHVHGECIDVFFDTDIPLSDEAFTQSAPQVGHLFRRLFSVWCAKDEGYYYECMGLLYQILAHLQKTHYLPDKQYQFIQPAIAYIEEHLLDNKISTAQLADYCGISYSYLGKLFLKKFGKQPMRYILERKLAYACDLMQSHMYNVTQTAEICGYSDVSFFSRQFKKYLGISPSTFLQKHGASK